MINMNITGREMKDNKEELWEIKDIVSKTKNSLIGINRLDTM